MTTRSGRPSCRGAARTVFIAIAAVVALTLSGCVTWFLPARAPRTSTPATESVPAALQPFYSQRLTWSDCASGMQCSTAKAPLNWNDPGAGEIELALIRQPAKGAKQGSLLVNPGGPGGSGYDFVKDSVDRATDSTLQDHFDVVGFDPRGVGRSSAVRCYGAGQMDDYLYGITPGTRGSDQWIAENTAVSKNFGAACEKNTGALLDHVDTVSAARDLDLLRAALGDKKLNYLGYSYGTYLGAVYAGLYPGKTGRLVFDGALDPAVSYFDVTKAQAEGFESALSAYLKDCLPQKGCPFAGTVEEGMRTVSDLLASVEKSPIRNSDGRMLGADTLVTAIIYPLYDATAWSYLSKMFESVMKGSAAAAFTLADAYNSRSKDGTENGNSTEAFSAINCLDYSHDADPVRMRAQAAELTRAAPVIGPYMSYGEIGCANWPYKSAVERGPIAAKGSAPILVVGTTNDPATPYVWAKSLAGQLENGRLLRYKGEGHTAYNKSNSCVNDTVDSYLVNGVLPADGKTC
ncbi:peptidase [Leifsonia xyli subsp. cynodontis DSM 46306]|uniref:Peptidase S33 tripeptidyl aminopeptidase-like C-terminal domain-containing protein n=1 Tax=Leifsonia xyli subsp. cynodontis DSM 46306 TaxID=1389489 RepID=U3PF95_LEIXC|nr:alpha/beta hydrolase [Leifsonia xyli]AGW42323.1 peptidase [Leifsonia xyli subsp. cynodontis DSM 46306]